ncbi:MAG: cytochrome P450 [Solirubrobacteraceae bacterium]|nr:cytochrome P450 [Solirubrobacteraceae bacterium]
MTTTTSTTTTASASDSAPLPEGLPPGPRTPAPFQLLGLLTRGRPFLRRNQERYGDLFTLRLTTLGTWVFPGTTDLIRTAFTAPADVLHTGESNLLEPILGPYSLLSTDRDQHLRQRRLLLPPFHGARMKAYEQLIEDITREEIAKWPVGEEFPVVPSTMKITLRAILGAVFGAEGATMQRLEELLPELVERGSRMSMVPYLHYDLGRFSPWGRFVRLRREVDATLDTLIDEARRDPDVAERGDVLALLVQARYDDGEPMGNHEIRDQLVTMLAAGHETTANTLGWAVERLTRHPEVLARVVQAVDEGDSEYLAATVREIQRVRPVIMFTTRLVKQPFELGGYVLPPGTRIALGGAITHYDERLFPNARELRPERFVGVKPGTYSWLPFGGGVRRCIGAAFAHMEMEVVLRTMLETYELIPTTDRPERMAFRGVAHAPGRGGRVTVRPRASAPAAASVVRETATA